MARTERTCTPRPHLALTAEEYEVLADVTACLDYAVTTITPDSILLDVFAHWLWRLEMLAKPPH